MNWISTKDHLPETLHKVLFFWVTDTGTGLKNISMGFRNDRGWTIYLPYTSYDLNSDYIQVTHWMELPDYPQNTKIPSPCCPDCGDESCFKYYKCVNKFPDFRVVKMVNSD